MRGPIELLTASWNMFKENWKLFLGIFLVPGLMTAVVDYLNTDTYGQPMEINPLFAENAIIFILLAIVFIAILLLMNIAMYKAVVSPQGTTIQSAYQFALSNFVPYLVVSIIMGVVVFLGFIALVIPGIIFAVWFSFSYFTLLSEGKKGIEALKASREYVRGHWWPVFGRFVVLCIAMIILSIVIGILGVILAMIMPSAVAVAITSFITSAVAMPIAIAFSYLLYQDLKGLKGSAVTSTPNDELVRDGSTPVESM
jgi:hypothetical protein